MRKLLLLVCFTSALFVAGTLDSQAQDMVYQPKNPAFGGDTFNYQWLQSSAQAQDKLKDPSATSSSSMLNRDPLQDFQESLNRQILSQLSRQLVVSQFGEGTLAPGEYTVGNYQIEVTEGRSGINIVITDISNGNQTTVTVPYY
ncbi:curli assembly protein CsgF [Pontibacter sp. FD36]|uniref:curli production assembly/transport component CsgF n=1 Tax=Pontibacter sp. FD36 TaxID=2789860 RepID=UPI0018AB0502|nr:curli production assembly/transport component CsgF [Pontibacter sp. FD36]MBF8964945.1 curli assembly protein CsgF [Pontibacter sp. FD36]